MPSSPCRQKTRPQNRPILRMKRAKQPVRPQNRAVLRMRWTIREVRPQKRAKTRTRDSSASRDSAARLAPLALSLGGGPCKLIDCSWWAHPGPTRLFSGLWRRPSELGRAKDRKQPVALRPAAINHFAEAEGFEPPVPFSTTVFKTAAIDHSATPPKAGLNNPIICYSSFEKNFHWNRIR